MKWPPACSTLRKDWRRNCKISVKYLVGKVSRDNFAGALNIIPMTLDNEIQKILESGLTKSEKNQELKKLGLRETDINMLWLKYEKEHPKPSRAANVYDAVEDFRRHYPDAPDPKRKEVLNLILRKEIAEEIIRGEKKVEIREVSPFYKARVWDKRVEEYINEHPEISHEYGLGIYDPIVQVDRIHFYSYSNTWHLDVECNYNTIISVCDADVKFLQEEYGCHEFDQWLADLNRQGIPEDERPQFFIFVIGKILDKKL